jgi:hypothetical protein
MLGYPTIGTGTDMTQAEQILLSGALTFGVPLVLALRDLMALRRGREGGNWPPQPEAPPPQPNSGSPALRPPLRKELPTCLIPVRGQLAEPRPRIREFA